MGCKRSLEPETKALNPTVLQAVPSFHALWDVSIAVSGLRRKAVRQLAMPIEIPAKPYKPQAPNLAP